MALSYKVTLNIYKSKDITYPRHHTLVWMCLHCLLVSLIGQT